MKIAHNAPMLRVCLVLLLLSAASLITAACAQTAGALATAEATDVAAVAATQVSDEMVQQANQVVNNVEAGENPATQPIIQNLNTHGKVLIIPTADATIIIQNGVQTIVFKPQVWERIAGNQKKHNNE